MKDEFNTKIEKPQITSEEGLGSSKTAISKNEPLDIHVLSHDLKTIGELKKMSTNRKRELTKGGIDLQFRAICCTTFCWVLVIRYFEDIKLPRLFTAAITRLYFFNCNMSFLIASSSASFVIKK